MVASDCDWYRREVPYGTVLFAGRMAGSLDPMAFAITERALGTSRALPSPGRGALSMFGVSAASRRFLRLRRILIGLQISLLVFSMAAPIGTTAADPSADPSASPAPTADPTVTPTDPPPPLRTPNPTEAPPPTSKQRP